MHQLKLKKKTLIDQFFLLPKSKCPILGLFPVFSPKWDFSNFQLLRHQTYSQFLKSLLRENVITNWTTHLLTDSSGFMEYLFYVKRDFNRMGSKIPAEFALERTEFQDSNLLISKEFKMKPLEKKYLLVLGIFARKLRHSSLWSRTFRTTSEGCKLIKVNWPFCKLRSISQWTISKWRNHGIKVRETQQVVA